jgi:hypothetical protein
MRPGISAVRRLIQVLVATAGLGVLGVGCSLKPAPVRPPFWPSWATSIDRSIGNQLAVAATAWDRLMVADPHSAEFQRAEAAYEGAVASVLADCGRRQLPKDWEDGRIYRGRSGAFALHFAKDPAFPAEISPQRLDRLRLAGKVTLGRGRAALEQGVGVPVVGQIARTEESQALEPMLPPNGAQLTLSALLEFSPQKPDKDSPRSATLRLINPLHEPRPKVGGRALPLAANYAPAKSLALRDGFLRRYRFVGLLQPEKVVRESRLYMLDPYDPKRIPVVFVHGLLATPHNWYHVISAINEDPELRARYQPWYFLYPTGLDIPYSAHLLRQSLSEARQRLDPDHNDPGMNQMVLVGHSMGGLLCRLQTIDSKDLFLKSCFNCSLEELNLSAENRRRLEAAFTFKKQPYVKRLIFLAVPHKGSRVADVSLLYRMRGLIKLPSESMLLTKEILSGHPDALAPQIKAWGEYAFLSLGNLSPRHPYLQALNSQPIPVPHHSIVGKLSLKPLEESTDGVVPYQSAHLETGTELVVPKWHGLTDEPEAVEEVLARLRQHLRELR